MSGKTKVGLVSLGCPKNLVDSEVMLGLLAKDGYELTPNEADADVMIVNTCSFIEDSKKESIDTILDVARRKSDGTLKKLIVTGCLAQRYRSELEKELPEVDHFIGTGEFHRITEFAQTGLKTLPVRSAVAKPEYVYDYATPRISTLPKHTAYVKIAEGCSRTCSFCIIPKLRGQGRSRTVESVVAEARQLVSQGALELNLIAQDLTAYGHDLKPKTNLETLLEELIRIEDLRWVRLMYNYPMFFTDRLIDLIATSGKVCRYLDIPLQHIDSALLATMRRYVNEDEIRGLIKKLNTSIPGLTLRTTLIVGFPGETDAQFEKLRSFVKEMEFDRLGVFTYSQEEGTVAATLPNQIPDRVKKERRDELMKVQQAISARKHRAWIGRKVDLLVDGPAKNANGYGFQARTEGQALEIDGHVLLKAKAPAIGQFVRATITDAAEYDLYAQV